MLDIGWPELLLIGVITVLVVGPKELPRVLRTVTGFVRKAQGLAREFQTGMNDLARQADLDDLRKDMKDVERDTTGQLKIDRFDRALDPDNSVAGMFTGRPLSAEASGRPDSTPAVEKQPAPSDTAETRHLAGVSEDKPGDPGASDTDAAARHAADVLPIDFPAAEVRKAEVPPEREKRRAEA